MSIVLTTAPVAEPVTVDELKAHARIDQDSEDGLLAQYLKMARKATETYLWRQLVSATYTLKIDRFPTEDYIDLPLPPLVSVTSVKYYDTSNALQTFSSGSYTVDVGTEPGRIYVDRSVGWPSTYDRRNAVEIVFVAGYGNAAAVPDTIKVSIMQKAAHAFENRETVVVGVSVSEVPQSAQLLDDFMRFRGYLNINKYGLVGPR